MSSVLTVLIATGIAVAGISAASAATPRDNSTALGSLVDTDQGVQLAQQKNWNSSKSNTSTSVRRADEDDSDDAERSVIDNAEEAVNDAVDPKRTSGSPDGEGEGGDEESRVSPYAQTKHYRSEPNL